MTSVPSGKTALNEPFWFRQIFELRTSYKAIFWQLTEGNDNRAAPSFFDASLGNPIVPSQQEFHAVFFSRNAGWVES